MDELETGQIFRENRFEIVRILSGSVELVWNAISHPDEVYDWMGYPVSIERYLGGRVYIDFKDDGYLRGVICEWEPYHAIAYTWDVSVIKWTVSKQDETTQLTLTISGISDDDIHEVAARWHSFVDQLQPYLTANQRPKERLNELIELYKRKYNHNIMRA